MITIRPMRPADRQPIAEIIKATDVFSDDEFDVAMELIDIYLGGKAQSDYILHVAEKDGVVVGYVCYGPTDCTEGTFDLYWIAVSPSCQGSGIGKQLMAFTEREVASKGGRIVIIETSSQLKYKPTQDFYLRNGYVVEARVKDFYRNGDDRLIYTKRIQAATKEVP